VCSSAFPRVPGDVCPRECAREDAPLSVLSVFPDNGRRTINKALTINDIAFLINLVSPARFPARVVRARGGEERREDRRPELSTTLARSTRFRETLLEKRFLTRPGVVVALATPSGSVPAIIPPAKRTIPPPRGFPEKLQVVAIRGAGSAAAFGHLDGNPRMPFLDFLASRPLSDICSATPRDKTSSLPLTPASISDAAY